MPSKTTKKAPKPSEVPDVKEEQDSQDEVELPDLDSPYAMLELKEDATADQIKKAYRKLSLKHHPDKAASDDKETATATFQKLTAAYALLSDERRRARYDATGDASETLLDDDSFNWSDFFREQFQESVTGSKIAAFTKQYQRSEEERADVLKAYSHESVRGNMSKLFERVMLSNIFADEERFREIIDAAIKSGDVEAFPAYTSETAAQRKKRLAKARREAEDEAEEAEVELKKTQTKKKPASKKKASKEDDLSSLTAMIQAKNRARGERFLVSLEAKYSDAPPNGKTRKRRADEPSEEEFAAIQAKLMRKK